MNKAHLVKLKPIPAHYEWEWYRGNIGIVWDIQSGKGRDIEVFATKCKCGQWWGWTPILDQATKIRDAMAKLGCPRCRKRRG